MRVVVFTGDPHLEDTPWWRILVSLPDVDAILVCRRMMSRAPADVWGRFKKNVKKHGLVFVPWRLSVVARNILARPFRRHALDEEPPVPAMPVDEIESLDIHGPDVLARVRSFDPDLGLSLGAPVLRAPLFRIPKRGTLNLHLGKVPDFRGAPPAFWELMHDATSIGATVHWMDEGLDTGDIVASGEVSIYSTDTLQDVEQRAEEMGARLFGAVLRAVVKGDVPSCPQPTGAKANRFPTLRQRWALDAKLRRRGLARWAAPRRLSKAAAMRFALYVFRPVRDVVRTMRRTHPVHVFTLHRVTRLCRDGMTVDPATFRRQVAYIARSHDIVSLEQAVELIRNGARLARPAAVLTFDDAYRSVFDVARPILAEVGVSGCVFVSTDLVGTDKRFGHDEASLARPFLDVMTWEELATLRDQGWSFGAHTATHARLSELTGPALEHEIVEPRRVLRERLGVGAEAIAFPFGDDQDISEEAKEVAQRAGHTTMFRNYGGENATGNAGFLLGRFDIGADKSALAWKAMIHGIDMGRWRGLWPV